MNISYFYSINDDTLPTSFEDSEFNNMDKYIGEAIKSLVTGFTTDENENEIAEIPKQLATGGIANKSSKSSNKEQKWSFCSEMNSMNTSLVALLGFDFAKYLFALVGIKKLLQNLVNSISKAKTWNDLIQNIKSIYNIYCLHDNNKDYTDCLLIDSTFDIHKYIDNPKKVREDGSLIMSYFLSSNDSAEVREVLFAYINEYIDDRYKTKTESLRAVVNYVSEIFNDLFLNTQLRSYTVNSVNELCLNLENFDICYSPSMLKTFETYYRESYGDIATENPHLDIIEHYLNPSILVNFNSTSVNKTVKKIETKKLIDKLTAYYKGVFANVKTSAIETLQKNVLNVICTDECISELVNITIFLFVQIARNLANELITNKYCGESTRIQFEHFFKAVLACCPHLEIFNVYQRNALYWILCPKKALEKSLSLLQGDEKQ